MDWLEIFKEWFLSLGTKYNVNPYIFGGINIGAIPFFSLFLYQTIRRIKNKKPFVFSALLTGFFFVSAYLYLIIVGKNIPFWVYIFIVIMVIFGVYSTLKKIKLKTENSKD
ncbi:MAG: hypothetical protein H7195_00010 [Chryseobacterium sp.]|nr:hypothetical protein [Chryseobacterium sp.]